MGDTLTNDDAPPAAAKQGDGAAMSAAAGIEDRGGTPVGRSVTINRPATELFAYWRDFANLARFMENVERVEVIDRVRSHWVVKAPAGRSVEWDAVVTDEEEDRFIAWASEPGADVPNSGRIDFIAAGARGTVVTATIAYDPPGGVIGKLVAKLFQREPAIQARRDLRRFKQLMETGEVATAAMNAARYEEEQG